LISAVRREKADRHVSLNTPIKKLTVCAEVKDAADAVESGRGDIVGACKVECLEVAVSKGGGREITDCPRVWFTSEY
jgi:hypothetical protein